MDSRHGIVTTTLARYSTSRGKLRLLNDESRVTDYGMGGSAFALDTSNPIGPCLQCLDFYCVGSLMA